jgi:hypothetical protein
MDQEKELATTQKILANLLDDLEENSRFDRWVEFFSAIILSLATVGTAWCGFQASQWNDQKDDLIQQASDAQLQAAQLTNQAMIIDSQNVNIFLEWLSAVSDGKLESADFLRERFPNELAAATEAWLILDPFTSANAPPTPFDMPEYQIVEMETSQELSVQYETYRMKAIEVGQIADRYLLLTVLFASVLFFAGVSGKFKSRIIDVVMLIAATILIAAVFALMISNPFILDI